MSVLSGNSNTNLSTILYGANKTVQEVYLGNALVWSAQSTSFSFSPTTLYNLSNGGGSVDITFTPGISDYVAGTWPAWVSSVTPTVVSGVTTKITVTYGENSSTSIREGSLTFFAAGASRSVPLTQAGTAVVSVTGVSLNKASTTITAGSTEQLTATVTPSNATDKSVVWSSSNTSVATVSSGLVTAVAAGSATITVRTNDGNYTATCTAAVTSASFSVQPTQLEFEHNESTYVSYKEVAITTAQSWTASITSGFTIHNNVTSGTGNKTLYIYPSNVNNNTTAKTGTLTITPNVGTAVSVSLTQEAAVTNYRFSISASPSGCTIVINDVQRSYYDCPAGTEVRWSVSKTGYNTQTGTYPMTASNHTETVTLSQEVSITSSLSNLSAIGNTYGIEVSDVSSIGWTLSSNKSWCDVSPLSGTGSATITVTIGNNTSTSSSRTATITCTPTTGAAKTCTVTQSAATAVSVSPSSITFNASGSTETITITGTFSEWRIGENDCPSWCTPSGMGGNTSTISVTSSGNTSGSTRTGSIVVNVDGTDYTISVSQEPVSTVIPVTGVSVSPSTLSLVAGKSSTLTANVTPSNATDKSVTWSSSNTSVASVNEYGVVSAVGAGSVTITATSNYDSTKTGSCSLTVAAATLTVSPTSMSFTSRQGTSANGKDLTITANGGWNMSLSGSGFNTDKGTSYSSTGNGTISVYPSTLNNSSSSRSATITFTAYGPISRTVSVTQNGVETLDVTYNGSTATSLTFAATDDTYAEGKTIYVDSQNQGWTASISNGWTIYGNVTSGSGPTYLRIYPSSANTGSTNKTGTLTIQGTVSGSVSVSLTQEGTLTIVKAISDGYADNEIMEYGLATYTVSPLIPVNWSIDSGSNICSIDVEDGLAYVSITDGAEIGDQVTIRATSTADSTKYATLTITVVEEQPLIPDSIAIDTPPSGFEYENGYYFPRGGCRSATFTAETDPQGLGGLITWELRTTSGGTWTQTNKAYIQDSINGATGDVEGLLTVTSAATSWTPMRVYAISTVDNTVLDYITVIVFYA